jgi:hypothetical protein
MLKMSAIHIVFSHHNLPNVSSIGSNPRLESPAGQSSDIGAYEFGAVPQCFYGVRVGP